MSDHSANDNNTPDPKAQADAATEDAAPEDGAMPEDTGGEAEKSAWELGPEAQIEALATETADLKDRLLRTIAEMENMRRRAERERDEARKYAVTAFARDILGVSDNMARAIQSIDDEARANADETIKTVIEGVEMTERELVNVFERHGITRVEPVGERFDPNFHQAMYEVENPDVAAGTVIEVVAAGYTIGERVLRPAMVGVARGGPKAARPAAEAPSDPPAEPEAAAPPEPDTAAAAQAAKTHEDAASKKTEKPAGKTVDRSA